VYLLRYSTRPVVHLDGACEVEIGFIDLEQAVSSAVAALEADPTVFVAVAEDGVGVVCTTRELRVFSEQGQSVGDAPSTVSVLG
jgi:hypothetical protein